MKVIVHSVLYCCLLALVAHCAELEVNSKLRKRLSMWPGSRFRRNVDADVSAETSANLESFVRQEDTRNTMLPQSSSKPNVRTKRSKNTVNQSRWQGCALGTCTVHDLAHRLHQLNNNNKLKSAPVSKISPQGYGRRRRRSLPPQRVALRLERGRLAPVWRKTHSQVHKLEALLRQT